MEQPRKIKVRLAKQRAFLAAFAQTGVVRIASASAGIHRSAHNHWLHKDPDYAAAFAEAEEDAADLLEAEAIRRAVNGTRKKKFYKNRPIMDSDGKQYEEFEYSDSLLMFLLKGLRPAKFREGITVLQTTGVNVQQIAQDAEAMAGTILPPREMLLKLVSQQQVQQGSNGVGGGNGLKAIEHNGHSNGHGTNGHSNGHSNGNGNGHLKPPEPPALPNP